MVFVLEKSAGVWVLNSAVTSLPLIRPGWLQAGCGRGAASGCTECLFLYLCLFVVRFVMQPYGVMISCPVVISLFLSRSRPLSHQNVPILIFYLFFITKWVYFLIHCTIMYFTITSSSHHVRKLVTFVLCLLQSS